MNSGEKRTADWRRSLWTFIRIMNVRMRFVFLMVLTGLIAAQWEGITAHWERWTRPKLAATASEFAAAFEYYCPMHPSVIRAEAGSCPICGMPLVKRQKGEKPVLPEGVIGRVQLSPYRIQLAGIATTEVAYRPIHGEIRTMGTIEFDERRVASVAARVAGRVEKVHVDFTGERVAKGDPLVEIYSPDLVSTQQEYLLARRTYERIKDGGQAQAVTDASSVLEAARRRLRLWGITDQQIREIETRGEPSLRTTIFAPIGGIVTDKKVLEGQYVMEGTALYTVADLSNVWMTAYVYEGDIRSVRTGQQVEVSASALSGSAFTGVVSFLSPSLDRLTRTLRIRADIPNPDLELRPGMYVNARLQTGDGSPGVAQGSASGVSYTCPMDPEVVSDKPGQCPICGMNLEKVVAVPPGSALTVPETAVIDTGARKVVYVEREEGTFDALQVELGPMGDGYYPVLKGLSPGDRVVTQGAFLVDAENRLNPGAAGSYFGASGGPSKNEEGQAPAGHEH